MRVIREITPRMAGELESQRRALQQVERAMMILIVQSNRGPCIPPNEHVMNGPWIVLSPRSRHAAKFAHVDDNGVRALRHLCATRALQELGSGTQVACLT